MIIGKGGQEVDKLKEELKKVTDKDVQINIYEVKRPELDAEIVAANMEKKLAELIAAGKITPYIQLAEYPGGMKALGKAISEELQFPEVAKKYHATAKVKLSFIVDEEGNLSDITVKEYQGQPLSGAAFSKLSPSEQKDVEIQVKTVLSVEAIRTITAIGSRTKWNPGSERGKVMSTKFSQTINFKR